LNLVSVVWHPASNRANKIARFMRAPRAHFTSPSRLSDRKHSSRVGAVEKLVGITRAAQVVKGQRRH
jgi:hypothetical protein